MFNIKKLFGFGNEVVESPVAIVDEKPMKSDAADAPATKGRKGRTLNAAALAAHDAVVEALTDAPQTRSAIVAKVTESHRDYVEGNWQGLILRLITQNKAKLAETSKGRGRNVSYIRA